MILKYSETELDSHIRYNTLYGKQIPGEEVTDMLESMQAHLEEKLENMKEEYESDNDSFLEHHTNKIDEYHSEISDRTIDIKENIKALLELLLENELPGYVTEYSDKIKNELDRLDTELFYELD